MQNRTIAFDVLKGIAIIAVVLYHFGLCPNGFLGVDLFLVIAGFFTAKSLWKQTDKSILGGGKYLVNRILRLLPLLLIAEVIILGHGFIMMLPDDFENNSQAIIASNFFSNNILANITTKNYWDAVNEFKPLMHTWYLGILMEFYVFFVIINLAINKLRGSNIATYLNVWIILSIISLIAYFMDFNASSKFYLLPFRIFEFGVGCITFYWSSKFIAKQNHYIFKWISGLSFIVLICLFFILENYLTPNFKLLLTVAISGMLVFFCSSESMLLNQKNWFNKSLSILGVASFSIFVWHQVVFALTRYSFTTDLFSLPTSLLLLFIISGLSILSYRYVEKMNLSKKKKAVIVLMFCVINASAFVVYKRCGIFYDIPELEITTDEITSGIWAKYCDNGYKFDRDFSNDGRPKWMVVGNSFGRDFVNIILESDIKDQIDLSYTDKSEDSVHIDRLSQANLIFISSLGVNENLVNKVKLNINPSARLVIVGEKNFGINNGQVFIKRNRPDYKASTIQMEQGYLERNDKLKQTYSPEFIDLIEMVIQPDGTVRVFSEDGRFISQDCRHLTKAGAQFYASRINWNKYL